MNADMFYEEFKLALSYLDVPWGLKELATIKLDGDNVVISYANKVVTFKVNK